MLLCAQRNAERRPTAMTKRHGRSWGQDLMRGEHPTLRPGEPHLEGTEGGRRGNGGGAEPEAVRTPPRGDPLGGTFRATDFDVGPTHNSTPLAGQPILQPIYENSMGGTSIFDPVLAELVYRWFTPQGCRVLDPFAGGSVRGIVASRLGHHYAGIELRNDQIAANERQAIAICRPGEPRPIWMEGDARERLDGIQAGAADLIFTCPPYGNLEVYSDDPRDISGYSRQDFDEAMRVIILKACRALAEDRFAIWVASDYRLEDGSYACLPSKIRFWHDAAGLKLYNEAILLNVAGSLPIRAGKQFQATRKLGRMHQEILVFLKGDEKRATQAMAGIDMKAIDGALKAYEAEGADRADA